VRDFPEGFHVGTSTAAHQVEGGNVASDWWAWEHAGRTTAVEPSGDAIDQLHRYEEDFALLGGLGHNAHRLSLEWARIEPAPGEVSRATLDHYRRVLTSLRTHGIASYVTLHHFTLPRWLAERGGWLAPDAVDRFARHCALVADELGDLIDLACTVNEPQIVALFGYRTGYHPPGLRNPTLWRRVTARLVDAHRAAVAALAPLPSGVCLQLPALEPARDEPACHEALRELTETMVDPYLDEPGGSFVGVQYYSRMRVDPAWADGFGAAPAGVPLTQMGWEIHPQGLRLALDTAARAGLPLVVTENGVATDDDAERVAYLHDHLAVVRDALADGMDVRGYLCWSAFDNFEWAEGFRPTFGVVGIDRADGLRRIVRPSAEGLGRLARSGQLADLAAN
jgi:beta-glucosidase